MCFGLRHGLIFMGQIRGGEYGPRYGVDRIDVVVHGADTHVASAEYEDG